MDYEFESFLENLKSLDGVNIFQSQKEPDTWFFFSCESDLTKALLSAMVGEVGDDAICKMVEMTHPVESEKTALQLVFHDDKERLLRVFAARLKTFLERTRKPVYDQFGLPDLSLVTIKQIAKELKQRKNLSFALVWMEESNKDNIAIEGNGNPTHLVGLLARGLHMAIEWSDKYLKFQKPEKEE